MEMEFAPICPDQQILLARDPTGELPSGLKRCFRRPPVVMIRGEGRVGKDAWGRIGGNDTWGSTRGELIAIRVRNAWLVVALD